MPLCDIKYICMRCGCESSTDNNTMFCECGGQLRPDNMPGISGTRDSFGIKNEFRDDATGKPIDNWKAWEKAGYRDAVEVTKNHVVKEKIKEKINRIKRS